MQATSLPFTNRTKISHLLDLQQQTHTTCRQTLSCRSSYASMGHIMAFRHADMQATYDKLNARQCPSVFLFTGTAAVVCCQCWTFMLTIHYLIISEFQFCNCRCFILTAFFFAIQTLFAIHSHHLLSFQSFTAATVRYYILISYLTTGIHF